MKRLLQVAVVLLYYAQLAVHLTTSPRRLLHFVRRPVVRRWYRVKSRQIARRAVDGPIEELRAELSRVERA